MTELLADLVSAIQALNSMSPLAVIGLLAYVIYLMVSKKGPVRAISDNHLSGLPEMHETLRRMETTLTDILAGINYLRGRLK